MTEIERDTVILKIRTLTGKTENEVKDVLSKLYKWSQERPFSMEQAIQSYIMDITKWGHPMFTSEAFVE